MSTIIDLTLPFRDGMRGVGMTPNTSVQNEGYNTTDLTLYSHAGTHMDAPLHFIDGARTIDRVDLEKCVGAAFVVDLSHKPPNSQISVEDLAAQADKITPGTRLLLRTDWDAHADADDYRTHMPRISAELARWLAERGIYLLGVQTPSVASLRPENRDELTEVHRILLEAEIVIVEGLANLRDLRNEIVHFTALPLKLDGVDGSPVRAIAIDGA